MTFEADVLKCSILGTESIHVGFHLLPYIFQTIVTSLPSSTYALVTDTNLSRIYLPDLRVAFEKAAQDAGSKARFMVYEVAPGEGAKSRKVKEGIEDWLLDSKCTRDTVMLAFGGGVIGDLTGFVAATFMRGVKVVQIPTTLLAMVDSSVGGKTAIDTPHGKNLIGAFWQPTYIFVDLAFLTTLPSREISNGMAEVVKTAAIWNDKDFAALESRASEITSAASSKPETSPTAGRFEADRSKAQSLLLQVVSGSIYVKAHIVTIDERETGLRNLVNFGHTMGHAIEAVLTPAMLHGECVSIGIILEAEVARQLGVLSQVAVGRLTCCLQAYGLPISLSEPRITSLPASRQMSVDRLLDIMRIDKKNSGPAKKIVLLSRIGKTYEEKASVVADDVIRTVLSEAVTVTSGTPSKLPVTMATPGSKSISNRALVLAALGKGTCRVRNLLHSDDTAVMMNALAELKGATFTWEDGGDTVVVQGGEGKLSVPSDGKSLYLGNAGTAARFLTSVCTIISGTSKSAATIITGNARMKQRPIGPLVDALSADGAKIKYLEGSGCLPLEIAPNGLKGGHIKLAASVSSQYVSSILLCAPYAAQEVTLELTGGQVISQPYVDMTIAMMAEFGVTVKRRKDSSGNLQDIYVIPKSVYVNPADYSVESDASSATYPLAIAAITGTTCTIANIGSSSLQGDARFAKEVLEPMGCVVEQTATSTQVTGPPVGRLRALGMVDMEPMTDAFLTASVLAAVATLPALRGREMEGLRPESSRIHGIANQRVKECNRIKAMRDELAKFGVETDEFDDGIIIHGKPYTSLKRGASVHCYDDHRVAMSFSVVACVVERTVIEEKRCVDKTWPNFWDDLQNKMGVGIAGVETDALSQSSSSSKAVPLANGDGHVITPTFLIGMRGVGKSYIGRMAADVLGGTYIDADDVFSQHTGSSVSEYVTAHDWTAFRKTETELLRHFTRGKGSNHTPRSRSLAPHGRQNASAGLSRLPAKPERPFVSAEHRPDRKDGVFRVVLITSGSVASVKMPDIVGALSKERDIAMQVVATRSSLQFYSQGSIDASVLSALQADKHHPNPMPNGSIEGSNPNSLDDGNGVRVWTDADEWSDWKKVGDPILHIELRRWADLVVIAPCSADMLAKIAGGVCDNLATSLLRALSPDTPTIICPAMNTHMYQHLLTAGHLEIVQNQLKYTVLGPQGAGRLACGDEGPGKMTDWREIVSTIQGLAAKHRQCASLETDSMGIPAIQSVAISTSSSAGARDSHNIIAQSNGPAPLSNGHAEVEFDSSFPADDMSDAGPEPVVIGLGGGIVESVEARNLLSAHIAKGGNVVYVTRELEAIEGYLTSIGSTTVRPNWGEAFADVYKRRLPWFCQCSNHEFYNTLEPLAGQTQEDHHRAMRAECSRFFRLILGLSSNRPRLSADNSTTFLSLTFPDMKPFLAQVPELTEGADAVELRVDLLSSSGSTPTPPALPPLDYVAKQLSMLRLVTELPIVFSVRSKDQGGMAPSDKPNVYHEMVQLGLRSACEYVDLEMAWPTSLLDIVTKEKRRSHIIASWHDWTGTMKWDGPEVRQKYEVSAKYGDVIKIVGTAKQSSDNAALSIFASQVSSVQNAKPLLAINMGALGQLSRITNFILTPVTHPLLPSRAAPGQLSVREINQARALMGLLPSERFFLLGSPIAHSVSPSLHNTGFHTLGYPHTYSLLESDEPTKVVLHAISAPDFGGASVTIPLKLKIMEHLDSISEDAKIIGAVNTIVPCDGQLHGENTDWQAIHEAASLNLPPSARSAGLAGLVIGAGGTCRAAIYMLHKLGASSILLFNRTLENAQRVKDSFPVEYNISVIDQLTSSTLQSSPAVVISTVPGDSLTIDKTAEGIYLDPDVLLSAERGVAIDMAYKPYMTALLRLAEGREGWKTVPGVEILCLQGFKQFRLWTGKVAPKGKIRAAVMEKYFGNQAS